MGFIRQEKPLHALLFEASVCGREGTKILHVPLCIPSHFFFCVMISHLHLSRMFLPGVMRSFGLASGACRCAPLSYLGKTVIPSFDKFIHRTVWNKPSVTVSFQPTDYVHPSAITYAE